MQSIKHKKALQASLSFDPGVKNSSVFERRSKK